MGYPGTGTGTQYFKIFKVQSSEQQTGLGDTWPSKNICFGMDVRVWHPKSYPELLKSTDAIQKQREHTSGISFVITKKSHCGKRESKDNEGTF
jgi:hypothetical protein